MPSKKPRLTLWGLVSAFIGFASAFALQLAGGLTWKPDDLRNLISKVRIFSVAEASSNEPFKGEEWLLIENGDAASGGRELSTWKVVLNSSEFNITGKILPSDKTKNNEGIVFGVHRASAFSMSYGSLTKTRPGLGAWVLQDMHDGNETYVGDSIGWDCEQKRMIRCPAILTRNPDMARTYQDHLAQECANAVTSTTKTAVDVCGATTTGGGNP
jgi:hypothetical protein